MEGIEYPQHPRLLRIRRQNGYHVNVGFQYKIHGLYIALIPREEEGSLGLGVTEMRTGRKFLPDVKVHQMLELDKKESHELMNSIVEEIVYPKITEIGIEKIKQQIDKYEERFYERRQSLQ